MRSSITSRLKMVIYFIAIGGITSCDRTNDTASEASSLNHREQAYQYSLSQELNEIHSENIALKAKHGRLEMLAEEVSNLEDEIDQRNHDLIEIKKRNKALELEIKQFKP